MADAIKFTDKEMNEVNELQSNYLNLQNALGQISMGRIKLQQQMDEFNKAEDNIRTQFQETQSKERDFIKKISEKYGDGNLDITNGVFTPKPKEKTDKTL